MIQKIILFQIKVKSKLSRLGGNESCIKPPHSLFLSLPGEGSILIMKIDLFCDNLGQTFKKSCKPSIPPTMVDFLKWLCCGLLF